MVIARIKLEQNNFRIILESSFQHYARQEFHKQILEDFKMTLKDCYSLIEQSVSYQKGHSNRVVINCIIAMYIIGPNYVASYTYM